MKPLYKLPMFKDVDSRVKQDLKKFKTYNPKQDNLDKLIEKVEMELNEMGQRNVDDENGENQN